MQTPHDAPAHELSNGSIPSSQFLDRAAFLLFCASIVYVMGVASIDLSHSVLGFHGFRQAQTAISIDYMVRGPLKIDYETPVLGPPWSVPFEFPLYQWIVALAVRATGCGIDPAGRVVSVGAFLLCAIPLRYLFRQSGLTVAQAWVALALLLTSPLYVFWARAVMIESLALLLALQFLAMLQKFNETRRVGWLAGAGGFAAAAALTKVTTIAPLLVLAMAGAAYCVLSSRKSTSPSTRRAFNARDGLLFILVLACALVAGAWWNHHSDAVRRQNVLAGFMSTGSGTVNEWVYGTLEQRLTLHTWTSFQSHAGYLVWPGAGPWAVVIVLVAVFKRSARSVAALGCVALGLVGPLLFTNLYVVHQYYWCANGVFFIAGVALSLSDLAAQRRSRVFVGIVVVLIVGCNIYLYVRDFLPLHHVDDHEPLALAATIAGATRPDDVVVYTGFDWSSEIPYYTGRRALMIPTWDNLTHDDVLHAIDNLRRSGARVGALVVGPKLTFDNETIRRDLTAAGLAPPEVIDVRQMRFEMPTSGATEAR